MYATITRENGTSDTYEVSPETFQQMDIDFGSKSTKTYVTLPGGKAQIAWMGVAELSHSETYPLPRGL